MTLIRKTLRIALALLMLVPLVLLLLLAWTCYGLGLCFLGSYRACSGAIEWMDAKMPRLMPRRESEANAQWRDALVKSFGTMAGPDAYHAGTDAYNGPFTD